LVNLPETGQRLEAQAGGVELSLLVGQRVSKGRYRTHIIFDVLRKRISSDTFPGTQNLSLFDRFC